MNFPITLPSEVLRRKSKIFLLRSDMVLYPVGIIFFLVHLVILHQESCRYFSIYMLSRKRNGPIIVFLNASSSVSGLDMDFRVNVFPPSIIWKTFCTIGRKCYFVQFFLDKSRNFESLKISFLNYE